MVYQDFRSLDPSKYLDEVSPGRTATVIVAAVNASLQSRAQADFVCDGFEDDVEINAALNILPASGGRVVLSEGTFTIVNSITIPANNITFRGQGRSTFIDGDGLATNEHAFVINGVTNTTIKKLAIQTEDGGGKTCHCIYIENGANSFEIEYVTIVDSDSDGIRIMGTTTFDGSIHNCHINDADDWGIYCDPTGDILRIHILDNFITGCGLDGIRVYNIDYGLVEGNTVYSNGQNGIYILNSDYTTVDDNVCVLNGISGIYLSSVTNSTVEDNLCYFNTDVNIHIGGNSDHNVVEGNQCITATADTADGIQVDGTANENSIIGNSCIGNGRYGIYVWGAYNKISSNHVCLSGDDGICIVAAYCQIEGNYVYDNGQDAAGNYHGIKLSGAADHCSITNNYCNSPGDSQEDGIHLEAGAVLCQIVGNRCDNGMGSGICLAGGNFDCQVNSNHCYDNDDYGIEILDESDRVVIASNQCVGSGNHGIFISESDYCSVTGNGSNTNGGDGIHVAGTATHNADYNTLTGNVCTGNTGDGIEISEAGAGQANKNIVLSCQLLGNANPLVDGGTNTEAGHNITV